MTLISLGACTVYEHPYERHHYWPTRIYNDNYKYINRPYPVYIYHDYDGRDRHDYHHDNRWHRDRDHHDRRSHNGRGRDGRDHDNHRGHDNRGRDDRKHDNRGHDNRHGKPDDRGYDQYPPVVIPRPAEPKPSEVIIDRFREKSKTRGNKLPHNIPQNNKGRGHNSSDQKPHENQSTADDGKGNQNKDKAYKRSSS